MCDPNDFWKDPEEKYSKSPAMERLEEFMTNRGVPRRITVAFMNGHSGCVIDRDCPVGQNDFEPIDVATITKTTAEWINAGFYPIDRVQVLLDALERIENRSLDQPAALGLSEEDWLRKVIRDMRLTAQQALKEWEG